MSFHILKDKMKGKTNHGLKWTFKNKIDPRKFKRSKLFGANIDVNAIPDFDLAPTLTIKNQLDSSMCTAFANTGISGIQEGMELSPEYAFQKTRALMGSPHSWGADPDAAMKAHVKFGCIEEKDSPLHLGIDGQYKIEDPTNWDKNLDIAASVHRKRAYLEVDGYKDRFDSILATMYESYQKFQQTLNLSDLRAVSTGLDWSFQDAPNGIVSQTESDSAQHNVFAKGKRTINGIPYIVIQNSYGEDVGDKGLYFFPRDILNQNILFARVFEDMDPDELKRQWGILAKIFDMMMSVLKILKTQYGKFSH